MMSPHQQLTSLKSWVSSVNQQLISHPCLVNNTKAQSSPHAWNPTPFITTISSCIVILSATAPMHATAATPLSTVDPELQKIQAIQQLVPRRTDRYQPRQPIDDPVKAKVSEVISLMNKAEAAEKDGDYITALDTYSTIIREYSDLALSERARVPRALLNFQLGKTSDALLQLEDEEVSLRGNPEVHAALAIVLHAVRPNQVYRAEQQWELASEFGGRTYENVEWVAENKHWPPAMLDALRKFLTLQ